MNRRPHGGRGLTVGMDILTDTRPISRLEIVDTGRRRRWPDEAKVRIVEESLSGPRLASATARISFFLKAHFEGR
jgi:transposase